LNISVTLVVVAAAPFIENLVAAAAPFIESPAVAAAVSIGTSHLGFVTSVIGLSGSCSVRGAIDVARGLGGMTDALCLLIRESMSG
jgi:ABC-type methionine transport system permease subunit